MKQSPPRWADRFLKWYCRYDMLEEIQGDVYELYHRTVQQSKLKADILFVWNVLRFFRWRNIYKRNPQHLSPISAAMIKNMLIIAVRNFFRQPVHSMFNVIGLSVSFAGAFLVLLWVSFEFSFDTFHNETDQLFQVVTHVDADGNIQSYDAASVSMDVSSVPEINMMVSASTGSRWPHVLCFRPDENNKECVYINGIYANENLFSVFNFSIVQGDQHPLKRPDQIAVSEKMASLLFNTNNVVGKTLKVDGTHEVTITSVFKDVPANSSLQFDFVMPYAILQKLWGTTPEGFAENFFNVYIKTTKPVSPALLTEKLNEERVLTEKYKAQHIRYQALPLADWRLNSKFENGKQAGGRIDYVILFVVIGSLMVIMAVINFINMTTARATMRAKEIGIRKVTGAYRTSIIFQFVGESFLVILFACVLAAGIAQLALPYFNSLLGEQMNITIISGQFPLYLGAFVIIVSLLAGLYPAFIMSSFQPVKILKSQLSNATGPQRLRKSLLIIQLSISIGIIIFSGVLYLQLQYITQKNLGFDRENMIRVEPTANIFRKFDAFKNELSKHASIISVATSANNPLDIGGGNTGVSWPGKPKDLRVTFKTIACSYEFPETLGLKLIDGRGFFSQPQDSLHTEVLITEEASKVMGLQKPVGTIINIGESACVITGVVNDFHTNSLHEARMPAILFRVRYWNTSAVYIKYQPGTAQQSLAAIGTAYKQLEPDYTMKYWFQDDTFNELYKTEITASKLVLIFTIVALVIACIGIASLATFNALRKTKEIGIRRVFGATIFQMLVLLFNEFAIVLLVAILASAPLAWYAADEWLTGFAYHTTMPWWVFGSTFAGVALLIILITWLQGMRAAASSPAKTLRTE